MKRCPECRRDYYDDTLLYCLDDGNALLEGPATAAVSEPPASAGGQFGDEPQTAILHETAPPGEAATRAQIHTTEQTAVLSSDAAKVATTSGLDKRLLFAPLALAVIVLGGFLGYRFFTQAQQINSIAVMPFVNESGNADIEYLSDGMTEMLIKSLSELPNLNVKPRSSVFRYKGKDTDLKTIGKELNVEAILNGIVIQRGEQLTLSLELVDVQNDKVLWTESYGRKQADLVSLQSEIAKDVSTKLMAKLSGADEAKVTKTSTANPEAYRLYLQGRYQWNKRTRESLIQAAEFYKQAIEKDPNYALAYSGLAESYVLFSSYGVSSAKNSMPQGQAAALRALEVDDSLAEAHSALEMYYTYFEFDRARGEKEIRRAIELNPKYATAHQWLAIDVLASTKRFDEALESARRAAELDPLSPIIAVDTAGILGYSRRYDDAIDHLQRLLSREPEFPYATYNLAWAYGLKGMYREAIAQTRTGLAKSYDPLWKGYLGLWLAKNGDRAEAQILLKELKKESAERHVQSYAFALIYMGLGEKEEALTWLEKEVSDRGFNANYLAVSPELDELRSEPRFKAMLKYLNLPE